MDVDVEQTSREKQKLQGQPPVSQTTLALLLQYQKAEETDHLIYSFMARRDKDPNNKDILNRIAQDEKEHAAVWHSYTQKEVSPSRLKVIWYCLLTVLLGFTFVIKLMEKGEYQTGHTYEKLLDELPEVGYIVEHELLHEAALAEMLDEERLQYVGSMVLGLNDALVELTGTLAGLTFALGHTRLVALSGIITGAAATLSMAASNYLAERADNNPNALKSSLYTGCAYLITVVLLILPYLLFPVQMYLPALGTMLGAVVLIIFCFNYYISVAKSLPFGKRFGEMACISLGVALLSFLIGLAAKRFLGIDI